MSHNRATTGRVLSVNVGQPRDVEWRGRLITTSIWKRPVAGPVYARRLNIDGDRQSDLKGHGGEQRAVMLYQRESYDYWRRFLGRGDFVYGQFGENLTVEGLVDSDVCIGDRFRIGRALFEVTQPRVTCYRLGIRMQRPDMPSLLVSHRRPGFYLRVVEEGFVCAGDLILKEKCGPQSMTVAETSALLYSPSHPRDALRRALQIEALSPGWRHSFEELLAADGAAGNPGLASQSVLQWAGYQSVAVREIVQEADDVKSFILGADDGPLPPARAGQYVPLRASLPDGVTITRSYSLSGKPDAGTYRISVKREPTGTMSAHLHDHVQRGTCLEIAAPRGAFTLTTEAGAILLISAGIGATPLIAMLHALASSAGNEQPVWWLHAARDGSRHSFAQESKALLAKIEDARSFVVYSRPTEADTSGGHYDAAGHVDRSLLERLAMPIDGHAFICGPPGFVDATRAALIALGHDEARIRSEAFGPSDSSRSGAVRPRVPEGHLGSGPLVTFAKSGVSLAWDDRFDSLLSLAEACAVAVKWSCRTGVCHSCEAGVLDGRFTYATQPLDMPPTGTILTCCAKPTSQIELDL